jgi:hypothetical protein
MREDNLTGIKKPETFIYNPITQVLQNGAKKLLAKALEVEINSFLEQYSGLLDDQGKKRITRNGYLPEPKIQTGIRSIRVKAPGHVIEKEKTVKIKSNLHLLYCLSIFAKPKVSKGRNVSGKR